MTNALPTSLPHLFSRSCVNDLMPIFIYLTEERIDYNRAQATLKNEKQKMGWG
jgi:hypothetical protein